jgi:hypothetical protein
MSGLDWDREKRTRPAKHGKLRFQPRHPVATPEQLARLKELHRHLSLPALRHFGTLTKAQANRAIRDLESPSRLAQQQRPKT